MKRTILVLCVFSVLLVAPAALAQVPVIDSANLTQSQQTATNTKQILSTDQNILSNVQKTLQAVTGNRSSLAQGSLAQMALGGGFSMGSAPSLGSVISGGPLSFAGLGGNSQQIISTLISSLNLVKSLSGLQSSLPSDKAFLNSSNTASLILGLINSTQGTVQSASTAYTTGARQIGSFSRREGVDRPEFANPVAKRPVDRAAERRGQYGCGRREPGESRPHRGAVRRARAMQFKPYGQ